MSDTDIIVGLLADILIAIYDMAPEYVKVLYLKPSIQDKIEKLRSIRSIRT